MTRQFFFIIIPLFIISGVFIGSSNTVSAQTIKNRHTNNSQKYIEVFVDINATSEGEGTFDKPFENIQTAVDYIRSVRHSSSQPAFIYIRKGIYPAKETIELTKEDSHITLSAWQNEKVEITGGTILDNSKFTSLSSVKGSSYQAKNRIKKEVVPHIFVYDLKKDGIDPGEIRKNGFGWEQQEFYPELCINRTMQTLAQYPNGDEYMTSAHLSCKTQGDKVRDKQGSYKEKLNLNSPVFNVRNLPSTYKNWGGKGKKKETDGWLSGCFAEIWSEDNCKIISTDNAEIRCQYPSYYGVKDKDIKLKAVNLLCELDAPGEYYIDRRPEYEILYFYPEGNTVADKDIMLTTGKKSMMNVTGATEVKLSKIIFSGTTADAINLKDCDNCTIEYCEIYGVSGNAIILNDNTKTNAGNTVINCKIHDMGCGGVNITGGNKKALIPGNDIVTHCEIYNFSRLKSYTPAVNINGVAHKVTYNYIHDAPHMAIRLAGNDNLISHNHIANTCMNTGDMAPIYLGRDLMMLGNEVSYNFIENTHPGFREVYAIYFDDSASGGIIRGNIIKNVGNGILPNKGYGYYITDNIFIDIPGSSILFSTYGQPDWHRPVVNEADLKASFYDKMTTKEEAIAAGIVKDIKAKSGFWNTEDNIKKWINHYDKLYNSLPDVSTKPQFRFSLGKKYFPAADNTTTAFSDPNSVLCGANMTIMRNITVDAGELRIYKTLYGGSNASYTDPATFNTRCFSTTSLSTLGLDLNTGRISSSSPLSGNPYFGNEWLIQWNENHDIEKAGIQSR